MCSSTKVAPPSCETVQHLYAAFRRNDVFALLKVVDEEVAWHYPHPHDIPWGGDYHGREGVGHFFQTFAAHVTVESFEPVRFVCDSEHVVVLGRHTLKIKATGRRATAEWAHHWLVRDGKVTQFRGYMDTATLVDALRGG